MTANMLLDSLHDLWDGFITRLPSILSGILVLVIFYLLARVIRFLAGRSLRKARASEHAALLVSRLSFIGVIAVGVLVSLGVMGVNAGALVASLGLVSVGIGFALKDIIENFLAGIILILQRPFMVGDVVRIGDVEGMVEDVRVRDTVIRMYDGRQVFVPNAGIFTEAVINNNRNRRRRIDFEVSVAYSDDEGLAARVAAEALSKVQGALADPSPLVVVTGFGEGSLGLKAYFWIDPVQTGFLEARSAGIAAVKAALAEVGMEIPFPVVAVKPAP